MIAIVDYGMGNLRSLASSCAYVGLKVTVTQDADALARADKIILPGVGAYGDAMRMLDGSGLGASVVAQARAGKPLLGICLGHQLLFESSAEGGRHAGLGLLRGTVERICAPGLKVPHMGWNDLTLTQRSCPLWQGLDAGASVYFVHSYAAEQAEHVSATTDYGGAVTASVWKDNVFGTQFHPEKSGDVGLQILKNFGRL